MASTATGGVALLAIAWLAARRLTSAELGYFFSFLSFGAFVQLSDFGLSFAALQTAGRMVGTGGLNQLPGFAKRVAAWNIAASFFSILVVTAAGWLTFSRHAGAASSGVSWVHPWLAYVAAVFLNQLTLPRLSLREGAGEVEQMWRIRLAQEWSGGVVCLLLLHSGAGLWSLSGFAAARAICAAAGLVMRPAFAIVPGAPAYPLRRWMKEVWPFQWKMGVSGLAGFFIFRAFSPILLLEKGAVAAGQFGLAVSIMNLMIAVTTAWPMSHAAPFAAMHAEARRDELQREFSPLLWGSTALAALGACVAAAGLWKARQMGIVVALRLPDPITTSLILATAVVHHFVACYAVLLRTEGREPLLLPSVIGSAVTALAIWLAAHSGTLRDVAVVNLVCAFGGVPVVLFLLRSRIKHYAAESRGAV
jgi:hypothetical protein